MGFTGMPVIFPSFEDRLSSQLRNTLDQYGFERVWAWAIPMGFAPEPMGSGSEFGRHLGYARQSGRGHAHRGGSRQTRPASFAVTGAGWEGRSRSSACCPGHGMVLALENHIDLTADEIVNWSPPWILLVGILPGHRQ